MFSTPPAGSASTGVSRLPKHVVWKGQQLYFKRRVPAGLRAAAGQSTVTIRLDGRPDGSARDRQRFEAAHARAFSRSEEVLAAARSAERQLSAAELLGVAGVWAEEAGPQDPDTADREEIAAVLRACRALGIVLHAPIPEGWAPPAGINAAQLVEQARLLARRLHSIEHPVWITSPPGDLVWGDDPIRPEQAAAYLGRTIGQARTGLEHWLSQARKQLRLLGVVVGPDQQQAVALRLATTSAALGQQTAAIEAGHFPAPISFPDPPEPSAGSATFETALQRWQALRRPTAKTVADAAARLQELALHAGSDRLDDLTPEQAGAWRDALLQNLSAATVRRRLALARAVLATATGDGLALQPTVLDRLAAKQIRPSTGTARQRRPFTTAEASTLIGASRSQQGPRPLDRWGMPLGLATGARLEEIAGLRPGDVRQIDGIWVVVIEPHELRRLKNNSSARSIPIPDTLIREGFLAWAQGQAGHLLFPEPTPPAADPRLSHYASIRLGKIIRRAGIGDPAAVFHSSRHFTAQSLVDAGQDQRTIEQLLGHGTRSMTARYSRAGIPTPLLAAAQASRDWSWWPAAE